MKVVLVYCKRSIFLTKPTRTIITNFSHSLSNLLFCTFLIKIENNRDKNFILSHVEHRIFFKRRHAIFTCVSRKEDWTFRVEHNSQGDDQGCGSWIWLKLQEILLYDK